MATIFLNRNLLRNIILLLICAHCQPTRRDPGETNPNIYSAQNQQITEYQNISNIYYEEKDYNYDLDSRKGGEGIPWGSTFGSQGNDPEVK